MLKIGIVAAETSGDLLGSGLMRELKNLYPKCCFVGVGGPKMQQVGMELLFPMDALSVMGISEVIAKLPSLLSKRSMLKKYFLTHPPDIFIGIDAPDFNLPVETCLKKKGIKTIHYVSPSVWAWRRGRIKKIKKATDLVLTLFPFEPAFYEKHGHNATFVGHPLADEIALEAATSTYRKQLNIAPKACVLALLPGSRKQELSNHLPPFLETAQYCRAIIPTLEIILPLANESLRECFVPHQKALQTLGVRIVSQQSQAVVGAADCVLLASGTATLETMLLKKPMVVAHKVSRLTYWVAKRFVTLKNISLPNILADEPLVKEFIQQEINPKRMSEHLIQALQEPNMQAALTKHYTRIHHELKQNANTKAAQAVQQLYSSHLNTTG